MNIYYRVLSIDPSEHSMVVRYWTDTMPEYSLASEFNERGSPMLTNEGFPTRCRTDYNLTVYKTPSPSQEDLHNLIMNSAPTQWFIIQEDIKSNDIDTSLTAAYDMLKEKRSFFVDVPNRSSVPPETGN